MRQSKQRRQALVDQYIKTHFPDLEEEADAVGIAKCKALAQLPFWCGDNKAHLKKNYKRIKCCTTHAIGLPRHPATNEEEPLTPYQVDFFDKIQEHVAVKKGMTPAQVKELQREYHFFHVNKGRQMGFTEIVLRVMVHYAFTRYAGYNVGIIAATSGRLAKKDLRRLYRLFNNIPEVRATKIKSDVFSLVNGTTFEAFKANEEAITGDTRYKCILMDEAAKWRIVDDRAVFDAIEPIIRAAGGDLFLVSTPKGPIKMFYKIFKDLKSDYIKLSYDIWNALGNLYTRKEIKRMLASATGDPNQEYLAQFTIGEDAIYGIVADEDRGKFDTWDAETSEDDIDAYEEREDDWDDIHEE